MPADSFVGIWKFVARPNLCGTPACVKPQGVSGKRRTARTDNEARQILKDNE